jgi:transposase
MFLRRCERRQRGKVHTYWALVESYRTGKGSRQRVVAYLGELRPSEQDGWAKLGQHLEGKSPPTRSLFDPAAPEESESPTVLVRLRGVRLERLRDFGEVWLALGLWRLVGLDVLLEQLLPPGREEVSWASVAAILTLARFCRPCSELHIEQTWYRGTALEDLLDVPVAKVHTDRLYACHDILLPHKEALEKHLKERLGQLFAIDYDLLLYDITSTYFEGGCAANGLAKRGYSRDNRPDCLQICIGLVVTRDGLPLGYEVFAGNTNDSKTIETIVQAMEKKYGECNRVWVLDRGMVSEANLKYLREHKGSYIVGTPKALLRHFEKELLQPDWHTVQEGVEVKLVAGPDGEEKFILARSQDRRLKEQAMHQRFLERLEAGLKKMQVATATGRLRNESKAHQQLGRLLQKNWRAAKAFDVQIEHLAKPTGKARLQISWTENTAWKTRAKQTEGCYLLRTNLLDLDAATLWKQYIQLTDAEWAFRITKDELTIRPIWHQKADRVKAHILICFLAYVLWKTLAQWMHASGLGDAPRTLLDELAKIKSGDVVLPTKSANGQPMVPIRLRCVTEPDPAQKVLLHRLGIKLPRRLRCLSQDGVLV